MDHGTFMLMRSELNEHCTDLLESKAEEYARDNFDRLNQFKRGAHLRNCHSVEALTGMMLKHETSIHDMAGLVGKGEHFDRKKWIEKIGDLRNYLDLLFTLLIDEGEI